MTTTIDGITYDLDRIDTEMMLRGAFPPDRVSDGVHEGDAEMVYRSSTGRGSQECVEALYRTMLGERPHWYIRLRVGYGLGDGFNFGDWHYDGIVPLTDQQARDFLDKRSGRLPKIEEDLHYARRASETLHKYFTE